jgi:hypothetical protein
LTSHRIGVSNPYVPGSYDDTMSPDAPFRRPDELLGPDHPLSRTSGEFDALVHQIAAVATVLAGSVGALGFGVSRAAPLVIGATIVLLCLLAVTWPAWDRRRRAARDVVLEGREVLPIAVVQRERARLLEERTRGYVARSLERVLQHVTRRPTPVPASVRPLFDVGTVATVVEDLQAIIALLRSETPQARGVALAEQLLTEGFSPLYGENALALRDELRRVRYLLTA